MRTEHTAIFSQDYFTYGSIVTLDKTIKNAIYWGKYGKSDRMRMGFKFGFVVTKLR